MRDRGPWILGLANNTHNGAACLIQGSRVVVAMQEERLTRQKRARLHFDNSFLCVQYCLDTAGVSAQDIELVVECRSENSRDRAYAGSRLADLLAAVPYLQIPHHLAHAHSCAGPSGFSSATVLVVDGGGSEVGELPPAERRLVDPVDVGATCYEHVSVYEYVGGVLSPVLKFAADMSYLRSLDRYRGGGVPDFGSLGHMFSSVALAAFGDYTDAGKVMGLAPYGRARHEVGDFLEFEDRRIRFHTGVPETLRDCPRWPDGQQLLADLAASVQAALEFALAELLTRCRRLDLPRKLAYAGGVALNSVANHRVLAPAVEELFVLPAAEDSGTALGAALYGLQQLEPTAAPERFRTDALGRSYTRNSVDRAVDRLPGLVEHAVDDVLSVVVDRLMLGEVVGWFDRGAELGPRALGHRSILCDPRRPDTKDVLNSRVKHRESFRPFAPVVLAERLHEWFEVDAPTRAMQHMLEVCRFRPGAPFPAVVHVDGSGRVQALERAANPRLYELLERFEGRTGVPMLVNTSFNVMGEPIVETPLDAFKALLFTGIDVVVVEGRMFTTKDDYGGVECLVAEHNCAVTTEADGVYVTCETEHGRQRHLLPSPLERAVLKHCDGRSSLGGILVLLEAETGAARRAAVAAFGWLLRTDSVRLVGYERSVASRRDG